MPADHTLIRFRLYAALIEAREIIGVWVPPAGRLAEAEKLNRIEAVLNDPNMRAAAFDADADADLRRDHATVEGNPDTDDEKPL